LPAEPPAVEIAFSGKMFLWSCCSFQNRNATSEPSIDFLNMAIFYPKTSDDDNYINMA
jgi:hypothetical protein